MKQRAIIQELKLLVPNVPSINAAILYGSFARNEPSWQSDIDVALLVRNDFDPSEFAGLLQKELPEVSFTQVVELRSKIAVYFTSSPKLELSWNSDVSGINRNYLGSEISDVAASVLFDRNGDNGGMFRYLTELEATSGGKLSIAQQAKLLSDKFIYEFENFSSNHFRSDSYRSYFYYNIALHCAIQLKQLVSGDARFNFLPRNFANLYLGSDEQASYRQLSGSLYLPDVNQIKRNLLDFYYDAISQIGMCSDNELKSITSFLEGIYRRDFLWNFRDVSQLNPQVKSGFFFRSSSLTRYQNEPFFLKFLEEKGINVVVDLRDDDEVKRSPYFPTKISGIRYVRLPIDPRNQSDDFKQRFHYGTDHEIAYRHFAEGHKTIFKRLFEEITPGVDRFVVHCHAGKDRTGALVAMLSLLLRADMKAVLADYYASEMDTREEKLMAFLEVINSYGGVEDFLLHCGVSKERVALWRQNLSHNG